VELRSADGSALVHLLLAGVTMAAEWGLGHPESKSLAQSLYVSGRDVPDQEFLDSLASLPSNCRESSRILSEKRELYEREGIFPPELIDFVIAMLAREDIGVRSYGRLDNILKIMHKDLHKH